MDAAGLDPHDVDYVEMHGTGTQGELEPMFELPRWLD